MQTDNYQFIHLLHATSQNQFTINYNFLVSRGWVPLGNPVFGMGKENEHYLCQFATNRIHDEMVKVVVGDEKTGTLHEGATDNDFYIGKYLVTTAHWDHVRHWAIQNGYDLPGKSMETNGKLPHSQAVSGVSFYEACKWCNAKSEMEGLVPVYKIWREDDPRTIQKSDFSKHITFRAGTPEKHEHLQDFTDKSGYRLPSGCEWEWAANGGLFKNSTRFSGSDTFDDVGWESERGPKFGVGEKKPNALGIYDMSGLSHEWCWDAEEGKRMYRNGHLFAVSGQEVQDGFLKITDFGFQNPAYGGQGHGFRIVKSSDCAAPVFKL
jgi:formylglycine-generating enzyme required for sulfatase activity